MTSFEASVQKKWEVSSLEDLKKVASELYEAGRDVPVWLLSGQMGVGKTTLVRTLCDFLGTEDNVASPTFSLVNEYLLNSGDTVYHFDLYRLTSLSEAKDIGIEEYLYSGSRCLIEWPDLIRPVLPYKYLELNISLSEKGRDIVLIRHENQD